MRFPLDFIWISKECKVAHVTPNVPAPQPGTPNSELPTYASAAPAAYAFEINAGEAASHGIAIGDPVRFVGVPADTGAGCQ